MTLTPVTKLAELTDMQRGGEPSLGTVLVIAGSEELGDRLVRLLSREGYRVRLRMEGGPSRTVGGGAVGGGAVGGGAVGGGAVGG
ncbi:MAG: hypothetical protein ACRDY2_02220, partial [Acidimicrobiales bacterium]